MSLVKKLKDILFEEEEEYTEPIKIKEEKPIVEEQPKVVNTVNVEPEIKEEEKFEEPKEIKSERELFKTENTFTFPDFDEDEFVSNVSKPKSNVLEFERKKYSEKRNDYGRYERVERDREYGEKKKFKPSPIISPVYGILNQDYKAEDIVNKTDAASNISIEEVRKKAFEPRHEEKKEEIVEEKIAIKENLDDIIDEPVVTFFEEKDAVFEEPKEDDYKTIDDLLNEAADEIPLEETLEIPKINNLDAIEEELEKLDNEEAKPEVNLEDTLDSDLFELIDSMYDEREDAE